MLSTESRLQLSGKHYFTSSPSTSPNQNLLPLTAKINEKDALEIGGCDVPQLVEQFGSPLYILDEVTLREACRQYRDSFRKYYPGESQVIYASKAWSCFGVCAAKIWVLMWFRVENCLQLSMP
jgi:diaminopimelate decarboxylase